MYVSRPFLRMDFLCNSHAGITHLVSVLDLDNAIVGFQPEGWRPPYPHSDTANNADYLSERCELHARRAVRPTGRESANRFLIMSGNGGA